MVDVEHRTLGAFEEELLPGGHLFVEFFGDVAHHRAETFGVGERVGDHLFRIERLGAEELLEREVVELHHGAHLFGEAFRMEEVGHAHRAAGDLVFVSGTDAATRRADLLVAESGFARVVERHVVGHDERSVFGNAQTLFNVGNADRDQFVDFAEERFGREDDAVAEVANARRVHDAGRNQAHDGLLAVDDERVARIVAAVEANDAVGFFRQPVDDLALAFVAPLSADNDYILAHF